MGDEFDDVFDDEDEFGDVFDSSSDEFGDVFDDEFSDVEEPGFIESAVLSMREFRGDSTDFIAGMLPTLRKAGMLGPHDRFLSVKQQKDFDFVVSSAAGDLMSGLAQFRGLDTVFSPISASAAAIKAKILGQDARAAFSNRIAQAIGIEGELDKKFGGDTNIALTPTEVKIKNQAAGLDSEPITDWEAMGLLAVDYAEAFIPTPAIAGGALSKLKPGALRLGAEVVAQGKKVLTAPLVKKIIAPIRENSKKVLSRFANAEAKSPQQVSWLKKLGSSVGHQLKKQGSAGKRMFDTMTAVQNNSELAAGKLISDMKNNLSRFDVKAEVKAAKKLLREKTGKKLSLKQAADVKESTIARIQKEAENFVKVMDEGGSAMNKHVADMVTAERTRLKAIGKMGQDVLGEASVGMRDNYFPHIFTREALEQMGKPGSMEKIIDEMMKKTKGRGKNKVPRYKSRAAATLDFQKISRGNHGRKFGNLETSRVEEIGGWMKDPHQALSEYYRRAARRIEEARLFGPKDGKIEDMIAKAEAGGFDSGFMKKNFEQFVGRGPEPIKFLQAVRNFEVITKLGLAQVTNAPQGFINTLFNSNMKIATKAFKQSFTKEGREWAARTGATLSNTLDEISRLGVGGSGQDGLAGKFLKSIGFAATESQNRIIAALGGRMKADWAMDILNKHLPTSGTSKFSATRVKRAEEVLKELGIKDVELVARRGSLTPDEQLMAGLRFSDDSQFRSGVLELPQFFSSETGKTFVQFKSFAFNHAKFIKKVTKNDFNSLVGGDFTVLPNFLAKLGAGVLAGEFVQDLKMGLKAQNPAEREVTLGRIIENLGSVGGLGIASDLWSSVEFGKSGIYGFLGGPAVSDAATLLQNTITPLLKGDVAKAAQGLITEPVRQIPAFGRPLSKKIKEAFK